MASDIDLRAFVPPAAGKRWRHIMVNTHCSWLPGDERGFRNREHRIHSSGDYKDPPPEEEHAGLREYHEERSGDEVCIPREALPIVGRATVKNLLGRGHRLLVLAVSPFHAHLLVELPDDVSAIKTIIGWCKQKSSAAIKDILPGRIWAEGEGYKPVDNYGHLVNAFDYIRTRQKGAWVWWFMDGEPE